MKLKYLGIGVILATMTLSACDININTGSGSDTKDSKDSNKQSQNSNDNNNDDNQSSSNNNTSSDNNDRKSNSNNNNNNNNDDDNSVVTRGNVIDFVESYEGHSLDTDQYTYKEPEKNDKGNWGFSFTDNDGDLAGSYIIDKYGNVTKYDEDGEIDNGSDDDDSTSVTRGNVIDFVESYEGHSLDTDQYTYKEPEQSNNGDWGFSFTDKDGNLAGSYIVDEDGDVTKYDENGDPE